MKKWRTVITHRLSYHSCYWLRANGELFVVYKYLQYVIRIIKMHTNTKHILSETRFAYIDTWLCTVNLPVHSST